jgi:hypothetical protein
MTVDVEVWHWTAQGMRKSGDPSTTWMHCGGYVTVRDLERLLEEAHERGRRSVLAAADREWDEHRRDTGEP